MAKERPILFSTPMVQAILAGKKTQTRRLIKDCDGLNDEMITDEKVQRFLRNICPYGEKNDSLWVRETFAKDSLFGGYIYKASMSTKEASLYRWIPSIHMPRKASRLNLSITADIRFERLNDISDADAIAEGIEMVDDFNWRDYRGEHIGFDFDAKINSEYGKNLSGEVTSFASLWAKINGLDSWKANPFVWVTTFERGGERC